MHMDVGFRDSASTFIRMTQSYIKSFDYGTGPKNMGAHVSAAFPGHDNARYRLACKGVDAADAAKGQELSTFGSLGEDVL